MMLATARSSAMKRGCFSVAGDHSVEIDVRLVALIVLALAFDPHLHEIHAVQRHRRFIDGIHGLRAGDVDFQAQRGLVADRFQAVHGAVGNLHQVAFGSDERLLAFDGEADLSVLDDPPLARVGVEAAGRFRAGSHGDVVGVKKRVADDSLGPVRLALVLRQELGEFPQRPVGRHPGGGLRGNGRPCQAAILLSRQRKDQGECRKELHHMNSIWGYVIILRSPCKRLVSMLDICRQKIKGSRW